MADERGGGTYLIAFPERRGAKRKTTGEEFPAVLDPKPSPRKKVPYEMFGQVLTEIEAPCSLIDVSLSGIKIQCRINLEPGKEIGLYFLVPLEEGKRQVPINPSCLVIWSKPDTTPATAGYSAGLKLIETTLTASQHEAYQQFVKSLPESPKAHS